MEGNGMPVQADAKRWQRTTEKFYGRACIKFNITRGTFIGLSGRDGDIWEYSPGTLRAIVTNHYTANKIIRAKYPNKSPSEWGDETLFTFPAEQLGYFCRVMKVPRDPGRQLAYAIGFPTPPRKRALSPPKIKKQGSGVPQPTPRDLTPALPPSNAGGDK
jgi:hypothetical protein